LKEQKINSVCFKYSGKGGASHFLIVGVKAFEVALDNLLGSSVNKKNKNEK
jgi:hypothetical protein